MNKEALKDILYQDFTQRLTDAVDRYFRFKEDPFTKDIVSLVEEMNPTDFWSVFRNVGGDLRSLEGIEGFNSFLGNFIDDSYFHLVEDKEHTQLIQQGMEYMQEYTPVPEEMKTYFIAYYNGDDGEFLRKDSLMAFLKKKILSGQQHAKLQEEIDKDLE